MKKVIAIVAVSVSVLFMSCEGPAGKTGAVGPQGAQGPTGATGAKGESGFTARFYDFQLNFTQSSPNSVNGFKVPRFNMDKEYIIVFLKSGGGLYIPLPIKDNAALTTIGSPKIVDMEYLYRFDGEIYVKEWHYNKNGSATYSFRAVVVPMVAGGRLPADVSYESLKKRFNLKD